MSPLQVWTPQGIIAGDGVTIEGGDDFNNGWIIISSTGGGGGLPAWFQTGSGDPNGSVVPNTVGGLYFDTSGSTGLWIATDDTDTGWAGVNPNPDWGVQLQDGNVFLIPKTSGDLTSIGSGDGTTFITLTDPAIQVSVANHASSLYINPGTPVGVITPDEKGDLCIDTTTPALWQSTGIANTDWQSFSGISGFQTGSGSPNGVVTPAFTGALYLDQSGVSGLWAATGADNASWAPFGQNSGSTGISIFSTESDEYEINIGANGAGQGVALRSGANTYIIVVTDQGIVLQSGSGISNIIVPNGVPIGSYTPENIGDLAINVGGNPSLWQATGTGSNEDWMLANSVERTNVVTTPGTTFDLTAPGNFVVDDLTLNDDITISPWSSPVIGQAKRLYIRQSASAKTVAWSGFKWPGGTAPTVTALPDAYDEFIFTYDGANFNGATIGQNFS